MRRRFLKSRGIPNNRIYYLTSDMQKIAVKLYPSIGEATSDYGFGSPMMSNEFDGEKFVIICLSNITQIGYASFQSSTNLTTIQIPNSVTSIGRGAFEGCSSLANIEIPNSVTSIGDKAFNSCTNLTNIQIPNSVTSIGYSAFAFCTSLTSLEIPNSVTSIGETAFYDCSSLISVIWNSVRCSDFDHNSGNTLFGRHPNITSVTFGDEVEHIPAYLCYNLSKLPSIQIPNNVTSIGDSAFSGCSSLTSIEIPNSVTSIGGWVFGDCTSLTSVVIGNSVASIGRYAFNYCSNLSSVYVKSTTPPKLGDSIFGIASSDLKIYVPRASLDAYKTSNGWSNYADAIEPYDY